VQAEQLGVCPAYQRFGKNCWHTAGTLYDGKVPCCSRFLKKAMGNKNTRNPRVINSDKDGAITSAIKSMKKENDLLLMSS